MKYILAVLVMTFSMQFSAGSWAEWTEVVESVKGTKFYVDFDRIRKVDGLVYYWRITDRLEPNTKGPLSAMDYYKGDCETMRTMALSYSDYRLPMAEGAAARTFTPDPEWRYAQPDSVLEDELEAVCAH